MEIILETQTPVWTGGVDGRSNRLQETGIIGGLRWWYEAIVRGLGGYVSDPASDDPAQRAEFDTRAYQTARMRDRPAEEALVEGFRTLGAVEYLFGATGWARLFRLQAMNAPRVPLHFRSTVPANRAWLQRLFGREEDGYSIDRQQVLHGDLRFDVVLRRQDDEYAKSQLALLMRFVQAYGGLGAKLQHGFGQIGDIEFPDEMASTTIADGLKGLRGKIGEDVFRQDDASGDMAYDLKYFFHQAYQLSYADVERYKAHQSHIGNDRMKEEEAYLPCAFDLRYRGDDDSSVGFRRWLRDERGWEESDSPPPLGRLDRLMGPRSQWDAGGKTRFITDDLRTASRVYFGMPVQEAEAYEMVVFGFAPPDVISVDGLCDLCREHMDAVFGASPTEETKGNQLLTQAQGGAL